MKDYKKNADTEKDRKLREHAEETDIRYRFTLAIRKFMEKNGIHEEDYADKAEKLWESFEDRNKRAREIDPTARDYEEMLWNRLNPVRIKLDKLEKKPPSIKRFKDILRLITSEVLADAAHGRGEFISSDVLLKSFRLLAVTPKALHLKSVKPDDLLFTRKECEDCLKSYTLFIDAVLEEERAMLLRVPTKERKRLQKKSGDKPAENKNTRKARLLAHLFEMAGTGKYRYTGKHFNYLINNRNKFKTVSTPDKVGTPDTLGKIFEYYIVRAWVLEKGRNNAKKINELMRKFIDEVEIESCRDLFLNIYKSSKDTKSELLAVQKTTAPNDAKKFDDQIALADSLSKMMALELLRHKIDPDTAAQELVERSKDGVQDGATDNEGKKKPKRKRKGKGGRPKEGADEKNAQVAHGINWLLEHYPDGNPNEAALNVFRMYPNFHDKGYKPPKEGKRFADTGLAQAIKRAWKDIPDEEKAKKAATLKSPTRT